MIHVKCVDLGAVLQKIPGDLDGGSEVQRRLPIAAASVYNSGTRGHQLLEPIEHAERCRGVRIDGGATLDKVGSKPGGLVRAGGGVEDAETSGPPMSAGIDVCAGSEQRVDHVPAAALDSHQEQEIAEGVAGQGIVEPSLERGIAIERVSYLGGVVSEYRGPELFKGVETALDRLHVLLQPFRGRGAT
jgi:hypothetical protein